MGSRTPPTTCGVESIPGRRVEKIPSTSTFSYRFARKLAEVLKQGLEAHHYESLELMAPPHFLGLLRKSLDQQVSKRVTASFDQDFTGLEQ